MFSSDTSETPLNEIDFLANVSHEIRNPLNAIIGLSHLLNDQPSPEDQEEYIQGLLQTSQNLLGIVNNFMDFSKLNSGRLQFDEKPTDLGKLINRSLFGQKALAETLGLDLNINIDPELPPMMLLDSVKLSQVVINLVSNAVKFTEEGSVTVHLEVVEKSCEEARIRFAVRDTGIGIPEEKLETIFKAFNQGGGEINIKYGGTGLGLSISKSLIHMMGGDLKVASTPGKGSEFSFVMPFKVVREPELLEAEEVQAEQEDRALTKGLKVLVVDDNKLNRLVLQKNLERWEADFDSAHNGQEAVEMVQQRDYDLILMDLHMPVMDGFEATRAIRKLKGEKFRVMPVVAFSAVSDHLYQEKIKAAGITDFLTKPFQPKDLLNMLASHSSTEPVSEEMH